MAIPKITRREEQVLLSTGLLDYLLSPLTLQETALLDGPSSPSNCLIPACEGLSLAPFTGSVSPKLKLLPSVPATSSDEQGSDVPPSHEVPDNIAPKSLAQVNPHWETFPKVKEVTAPATIEFKTFEKEELNPSTGRMIHTRVIYPIITPKISKETESDCILVPLLLEAKGQLNSLVLSLLTAKSVCVDGSTSTVMTPREPPATTPATMPTSCADLVEPVPAEPTRDIADFDDVASSPCQTPTPPRQPPLTVPCTPLLSSPVRDLSSRKETPVEPQLQAESPATTRSLSMSPRPPCYSPLGEETEGEEGQFDDAEEGEVCELQKLHPSEQLLPPSTSPSLTSSPVPSQVSQLVWHILETKRLASEPGSQTASPDGVAVSPDAVAMSPDTVAVPSDTVAIVVIQPEEQGSNDVIPMDTLAQGETLTALSTLPNNERCTSLPHNTGRGALIKQLFAPCGAFAAPRVVCPPPVVRKSAKELTALEPCTLPPLLPRTHIQPMTIDYGCLSSSSPAPSPVDTPDTPIQAALNQVTSALSRLSFSI